MVNLKCTKRKKENSKPQPQKQKHELTSQKTETLIVVIDWDTPRFVYLGAKTYGQASHKSSDDLIII